MTPEQRDRELGFIREDLLYELRQCWASDNRWAPWKPEEIYGSRAWTERALADRGKREDHNDLMRAHLRRIRALDSVSPARAHPARAPEASR